MKEFEGINNNLRGRRAFCMGRSHSESDGGLYRSENAGISSENYVRIIMAESLRFWRKVRPLQVSRELRRGRKA